MEFAREEGGRPFYIFHDSVLREIAQRRPQTSDEFLAVPGVGPVKLERYGDAFLEVLRRFGPGGEETEGVRAHAGHTPLPPGINSLSPRTVREGAAEEGAGRADPARGASAPGKRETLGEMAARRNVPGDSPPPADLPMWGTVEAWEDGMEQARRVKSEDRGRRSPHPAGGAVPPPDTGETPVAPEGEGSSLVQIARELRRNPTVAEGRLWEALEGKGLGYKFRRQHPLGEMIVDFYCPAVKVAVLVGGEGQSDWRAAELRGKGLLVVEVKDSQVEQELEGTLRMIRAVCRGAEAEGEEARGEGW
jgi:very-short-patch-repair endonuclease